jgi:hypothetical protein
MGTDNSPNNDGKEIPMNERADGEEHDGDTEPEEESEEEPEEEPKEETKEKLKEETKAEPKAEPKEEPKEESTTVNNDEPNKLVVVEEHTTRGGRLRTSSERSLQAERQALKLKERQKKTNDAVNNMRKRLAAMGIVKEDVAEDGVEDGEENMETDTTTKNQEINENTNDSQENSQATENMSRIQNQNDQDIPIETDKEVVVAEQQRVQPPSIDTMETLTGPQQSPVSPTVSRNHSFY